MTLLFDSPDPRRAAASAHALAPILRNRKVARGAKALDICCPRNHRVATVYRVPGHKHVLLRFFRDTHAQGEGRSRSIRNERITVTDWLDVETAVDQGGAVRTVCWRCDHGGAWQLADLLRAVPEFGFVRRVMPFD